MISLSYRREQDHVHEFVQAAGRRVSRAWGLAYAVGLAILTLGTIIAVDQLAAEWIDYASFAAGTVAMLVIYAAWSFAFPTLWGPQAPGLGGSLLGDQHLELSAGQVCEKSDDCQAAYTWRAIQAVTVEGKVVVLWTDPAAGIIVPRAAFASPEDEKAFVDFAAASIATAASG